MLMLNEVESRIPSSKWKSTGAEGQYPVEREELLSCLLQLLATLVFYTPGASGQSTLHYAACDCQRTTGGGSVRPSLVYAHGGTVISEKPIPRDTDT
eukprot:1936414-Amphidinium_carterae.1